MERLGEANRTPSGLSTKHEDNIQTTELKMGRSPSDTHTGCPTIMEQGTTLDKWAYERIKHLLTPGDKKLDEEFQFPVPKLVRQFGSDATPQTISVGRHVKPQEVIAISRDLEKSIKSQNN